MLCALFPHIIKCHTSTMSTIMQKKREATTVCSLFLHYNFLMRTPFTIEKSVKSSSTQAAQSVLTSLRGVL